MSTPTRVSKFSRPWRGSRGLTRSNAPPSLYVHPILLVRCHGRANVFSIHSIRNSVPLQRDERVLIVWADNLDYIIPICRDFEDKLIKLVWRSRPATSSAASGITSGSIGSLGLSPSASASPSTTNLSEKLVSSGSAPSTPGNNGALSAAERAEETRKGQAKKKSNWFGWRVATKEEKMDEKGVEDGKPEPRPIRLFAPIYGGLGAGLSIFFIASGTSECLEIISTRRADV